MNHQQRILDDVADVRTGDKGDHLILAVLARDPSDYELLVNRLTAERLAEAYAPLLTAPVERVLMPRITAMVFDLPGVLGAGVTGSPVLDGHGKTMSYHALWLPLGD